MIGFPRPAGTSSRESSSGRTIAIVAVTIVAAAAPLVAQMATADRLRGAGWWPTKGTAPRQDYIGPSACVECHTSHAEQLTTAMARTAQRAGDSPVLRDGVRLRFAVAHYSYAIVREGGQPVYTVTDGERSLSAPLSWALGAGNVGQTYIFERDGSLYEARASFYATVKRLDFTPNRRVDRPRDLADALARPLPHGEARRCFACHMTASSTAAGFDLARATPGVTCEACHGPGRAHAAEMALARTPSPGTILSPRALNPVDSVDFCGACHATFWDVTLAGERGLAALRSQPHRLQSSRCWSEDERVTCVACHDPHKPLVRDTPSYDRNCLSCHATAEPRSEPLGSALRHSHRNTRASAPPCPTGTVSCAGCHMPKYDVPEMHYAFTDHLIRVVRR